MKEILFSDVDIGISIVSPSNYCELDAVGAYAQDSQWTRSVAVPEARTGAGKRHRTRHQIKRAQTTHFSCKTTHAHARVFADHLHVQRNTTFRICIVTHKWELMTGRDAKAS